jgi:hypothetical protein
MSREIGEAAGIIWRFLKQQDEPVTLSTLTKNLDLSSTLLMMGLGWLAREDEVIIEMSGNSYRICLKH